MRCAAFSHSAAIGALESSSRMPSWLSSMRTLAAIATPSNRQAMPARGQCGPTAAPFEGRPLDRILGPAELHHVFFGDVTSRRKVQARLDRHGLPWVCPVGGRLDGLETAPLDHVLLGICPVANLGTALFDHRALDAPSRCPVRKMASWLPRPGKHIGRQKFLVARQQGHAASDAVAGFVVSGADPSRVLFRDARCGGKRVARDLHDDGAQRTRAVVSRRVAAFGGSPGIGEHPALQTDKTARPPFEIGSRARDLKRGNFADGESRKNQKPPFSLAG